MTSSISENNNGNINRWSISAAVSLMVHLALGLLIFLMPADKRKGGLPFTAKLITPEELSRLYPQVPALKAPPGKIVIPRRQKPFIMPAPYAPAIPGDQRKAQPGRQEPISPEPGAERSLQPGLDGTSAPRSGGLPFAGPKNNGKTVPHSPSRKELFADAKEVAGKTAQKEETKKDTGVTFDNTEFRYHTYMARLKEKIESVWKYPPEAAAKGIYGDLRIKFTIKKNGMLGAVELERTSGHKELDEAAMKALKDAEPYWPLPEEWDKDAMTVPGQFIYTIYGTYIR